jgi:hypothetical protein
VPLSARRLSIARNVARIQAWLEVMLGVRFRAVAMIAVGRPRRTRGRGVTVAGFSEGWKKVRPKKIDAKTDKLLSDAFKEIDRANALWAKTPNRETLMALSGATKNAVRAVDEGVKSVNASSKDPKALKWFADVQPGFKAASQQATILQRGLVTFYQELDKRHKSLLNDLKIIVTKPNAQVVKVAYKNFSDFGPWINKESTLYSGELVHGIGMIGARAELTLKEIAKVYGEMNNAADDKKAKLQKELKGHLTELQGIAKRLATPLKEEKIHIASAKGSFIKGG